MDGYEIIDARFRWLVLPNARMEALGDGSRWLEGSVTVLADSYQGKRLNSPNDIVCKSDGTIWFSDPHYGINTDYEGGKQTPELPPYVYRFDPADGSLRVVADDFQVKVPATVANLAFGGRNLSRLFLCAGQTLYAISINKRGAERP